MGEASDRAEDDDGERPDSLEDFRKELHAGDGEEAASPPLKEGDAGPGEGPAAFEGEEGREGADRLSDEDLERFRQDILEEYGPDGLGEDTPEGQLYNMAREEKEAGDDARSDAVGEAGSGKDSTTTADGPEGESSAGKGDARQEFQGEFGPERLGKEAAEGEDDAESGEAKANEPGARGAEADKGSSTTEGLGDSDNHPSTKAERDTVEAATKDAWAEDKHLEPDSVGNSPRWEHESALAQADLEKSVESQREVRFAQTQTEGYTRNDDKLAQTKPSSTNQDREGQLETSRLQRIQAEAQHEREGQEAKVGPKEREAADAAGMQDRNGRLVKAQESGQVESVKEAHQEIGTQGLQHPAESPKGSTRRADIKADASPFPERQAISFARPAEQSTALEASRYNARANQTAVTRFERDGHSHDRTRHPEATECIRTAVKYMSSTALLVPESVIPAHTKDDVLEVRLARESESRKVYTLYCKQEPGRGKAYLDLRQLDAELHEWFRVGKVGVHRVDTFANEFNAKRPKGLENTELVKREQALVMKVDGREIPLEGVVLRSQEGRAVIDARLGNSQVKIANGVWESEIRLKDHSKVTGIEATSEGVVLSYQRTSHDPYPHRRIVMEGAPVNPHFVKREGPLIVGRIKVESRSHGRDSVEFKLRASDAAYEHVFNSLAEFRNLDAFKKLKGDIAEEIVKRLGPDMGMTVLADHPFNDNPLKVGSERPGPDLLVSFADSDELAYVEVKWWAYKAGATREAVLQVLDDLRNHPTWEGKEVRGTYIAIIDWNSENEWFMLTLKRAWSGQSRRGP